MNSDLAPSSLRFASPPIMHNARGELRKAGFEMEYAGVSVGPSAQCVRDTFGGYAEIESTFVHRVHTDVGRFTVEIDTLLLKDKQYETALRAVGFDPSANDTSWLERFLLEATATFVPIEIASPPVPIDQLERLDDLRRALMERGAQGTRASLVYAFGMHINPEVPNPNDPRQLLDHLRAFVLLYPWLKKQTGVDLARRVTPYVDPFPPEYARLILDADYPVEQTALIDDYLAFNRTRNRALDMLPVLAFLDAPRVEAHVQGNKLVKPRPSFHYRLPNCLIDEPTWSLAREWNTWIEVERLANDRGKLARMSWEYLKADKNALRPIIDQWPDVVDKWMTK